jgi:hypothetical protein
MFPDNFHFMQNVLFEMTDLSVERLNSHFVQCIKYNMNFCFKRTLFENQRII